MMVKMLRMTSHTKGTARLEPLSLSLSLSLYRQVEQLAVLSIQIHCNTLQALTVAI
jgi:hypothetical protein